MIINEYSIKKLKKFKKKVGKNQKISMIRIDEHAHRLARGNILNIFDKIWKNGLNESTISDHVEVHI